MQMRKPSSVLAALVLALGLGACGGGDDDAGTSETTGGATDATTTSSATDDSGSEGATGGPVVLTPGVTIWFAGFEVTVDEVQAPAEGEGGPVEVAATLENLSPDSGRFDAAVTLTSAGETYEATADVPEVPGEATGEGSYTFRVDDTFRIDDAVLTFGRPDNNQAVVPLGDEGELVTLEPVPLEITGTTTAGGLTATITGGEVRADVPAEHTQIAAGRLALFLTFNVSFTPSSASYTGGFAFGDANLSLTLPDGTSIAPEDAPIELIGSNDTRRDQTVRFEIDNPPAGAYQLVVIDDAGREPVRAPIPFDIGDDVVVGTPEG